MASLPSLRVARLSFAWRLGFLYAALFLVVGCYLPYLPVWLSWRRLDADQIAVLLAAPLFTRILFTPAISFAADRPGDRRWIVSFFPFHTASPCVNSLGSPCLCLVRSYLSGARGNTQSHPLCCPDVARRDHG